MKRLNVSAFFLACLLLPVFEGSAAEPSLHRGPADCEVKYAKFPRVFLDVSPIAIQRVLDIFFAISCTREKVQVLHRGGDSKCRGHRKSNNEFVNFAITCAGSELNASGIDVRLTGESPHGSRWSS